MTGTILSRGRGSCALLVLVLAASANCVFGQVVYVVNLSSDSISAFTVNAGSGALTEVLGSPFTLVSPLASALAGIAVDPSGKFLYATSARDLFAYTIIPGNGALLAVPGSPYPYMFGAGMAVDPTSKFVYIANPNSRGLGVYTVDPTSGALAAVAGSPFATDTTPSAFAVDPTGKFVYITSLFSSNVAAYTINPGSGALTGSKGAPSRLDRVLRRSLSTPEADSFT
jgi:6-phosphogluconolactonase